MDIELAYIAQFFGFSVGLITIYSCFTFLRNQPGEALKIYSFILIAINAIVFLHIIETLLVFNSDREVFNIEIKNLLWYFVVPVNAIRLFVANRFILFSYKVLNKKFPVIINYMTVALFAIFLSLFIFDLYSYNLFSEKFRVILRIVVLLKIHVILSGSIILSSAIVLLKRKIITHINSRWSIYLFLFWIAYAIALLIPRIYLVPDGMLSATTHIFLVGLITLLFNLFNLIFIRQIFSIEVSGSQRDNLEELFEFYNITRREQEIIKLICQGKTNKEIAAELFITPVTVRDHLSHIYKKTNVGNRTQLSGLFNENISNRTK